MSDIFDQIHAHATGQQVTELPDAQPQPDIFDQIHAHVTAFQGDQTTPLPQGTEGAVSPDQAEETARRRAEAQIKDIETGRTLTKTPGPNGETTYQYGANPTSGRNLTDSEKLAIYQAHHQAVTGQPANVQSYEQMANQVQRASTSDNTALQNFGGGLGPALAAPVAGLTGLVNPQVGNRMQENIATTYGGNPNSVAGTAGSIVGGTVAASPAILGGPAGGSVYAALMGTQAAGDARMEVAKARSAGQNVSPEQEIAYVLDKAMIAAAQGKITSGAIAGSGPGTFAANRLVNAGLGAAQAAGVGGVDTAAATAAGNLAAIGTGVDPNRNVNEGVTQSMIEGGAGAALGHGLHEAAGHSAQKPNLTEQQPNKTEPNLPVNQDQLSSKETAPVPAPEPTPKPAPEPTPAKAAEDTPSHPPELADAKQVGEWYGKTFNDPANASTIETMASMHPGKYKLMDVPVDKIDPNSLMSSDTNVEKAKAISEMPPEERAKLPPLIGVGEGDKVNIADGTHRFEAAKLAGDKTVPMYVPEEFANDIGKLKQFVGGEVSPTEAAPKSLKEQIDAALAEGDAKFAKETAAQTTTPPTKTGLPKIEGMEEMSYKELKTKAKEAGYDTTGKMNFSSVKRAVESQHADSLIDLPRPPKAAKNWSAKQYKYWAEQNGYKISDTTSRYDVAREINQQRKGALRTAAGKPPRTPKSPVSNTPAGPVPEGKSGATPTHAPSGVDYYATPIIRQMEDINKPLAGKVFESQFEGRRQGAEWQAQLAPHAKALKDYFKGKDTFPFQKAVYEGNIEKAKSLVPSELHPSVDALFESSKTALEYRKSVGAETPELKNHVHFEIKDYKAMQKALGKTPPGPIQEAWDQELAKTGRPVSEARKVEIANAVLNGFGPRVPGRMKAGFKKERGANFTRETESFYKPVWESQNAYLMHAAEDAQNTKLLGKDYTEAVKGPNPLQGQAFQNTSLGKLITQETNAGRLSGEDAARFKDLLNTHLTSKTASNAVKTTRDLINFATLTHVGTAIKQIGDVGFTAYKYGLKNTVKGTKMSFGKNDQNIMMKELGLDDVSHEMRDAGKLGNSVSKWMHMTGMMKLDILAKETRANAAILNHQESIKTPEGEAAFAKEYKSFLGDKYDQTVKDLKAGERTWHTDLLAAHELSKSQPLYRVNMTPGQAKSEGLGRLAYALKPFMLHQLDTVRREIFRNLATPGQRKQGLKNMAGMIGALSLANLGTGKIMNLINGKDQDMTEQVADSVLGIANLSSYSVKNGIKDPGGFLLKFVGPPTPILGDIAHDVRGDMFKAQTKRVFKDGKWQEETTHNFQGSAMVRNLPHLLGTIAYYWTPLGAGYHLEETQAKDEFRQKLGDLKKAAEDADASGDEDVSKTLIDMYNSQAAKDPDKKVKPISSGTFNRAKATSMRTQQKVQHASKP